MVNNEINIIALLYDLFTKAFPVLLTALVSYLVAKAKENGEKTKALEKKRVEDLTNQEEKSKLVEEALRAILHDQIVRKCERLLILNEVTREDLDSLEYICAPYFALNGNGVAKVLYNQVHNLKIVKIHKEVD